MIKLIFNRTTNLNFYDLILVIKSVDTKIFGAFYCIRTLYRFSLFATITLIGIWSKFIKLALIQLSPDNIVFYLLPYGFKVIFQCFKFSSYSFSNHFHLFGVANVILSADLAVIFFKYQTSSSSINRSSNGLLILLLKVSAMWTYLSVVLMLLCPISSFTILMSVPCSSKWVANEWRSRCG